MQTLHAGKAVLIGAEKVDFKEFPKNLQVIGCNMTGTDNLPWDFINAKGIKVISLEGETEFLNEITSTAEHTIGLVIALLRNYKLGFRWPTRERDSSVGHTVNGKTLGIIGHGRVGKQVERMAIALGMAVRICEKVHKEEELNELLKKSDVVSLHIPLTGNDGFFGKYMFSMMKSAAYFINTSRLGVVAPEALLWALKESFIAGAAVDFIEDKDLLDYERLGFGNLILTNHCGGNTHEDREKTLNFVKEKVDEYIRANV